MVEHVLDEVDRTYSRFRDDSELVALNASAGRERPVSPLLADAIAIALDAARRTNGAVDPTVGRAMRAIGYDADFAALPDRGGARPASVTLHLEPLPGWQAIDLSVLRRTVTVRRGVEIDLGSTGKALAADLAAAAIQRVGAIGLDGGALISLGGDIATVGEAPAGGWRVLVAEDSEESPDAAGEVVAIPSGAVATSSTTVRRWHHGEREMHHLVDPGTGGPVNSPWRTATVAAVTCVAANTAATAAIVLGNVALEWLEASRLPARLVATNGAVSRLNGWPERADDGVVEARATA
ncbi:MAG TPA: FAD:protein FMN transferase [Candidatus Limnocylindrales bacterium]|nr:FAD:protein FMN transferase [Candidatus Limnocylindrales bacterium]